MTWKDLPQLIKVDALLLSKQYGHANFLCVSQLKTIVYVENSIIVHIKAIFI